MIRFIVVIIFLSSCATNSDSYQPLDDKALLVAEAESWGKSFIPLETQATTRIESVNGEKVSDFFKETNDIAIDPGEHTVVVSCYIRRGGLHQKADREFSMQFDKGVVYIFTGKLGTGKECEVEVNLKVTNDA